ncbi:glycoside hydrolase family 18 protein [Roridomyces roridus]|uniref:Glycoside hydrolase family 18 protein n=1 Tax=Roridomyces roridus TaxID=1738132 RepID=A0AAD7BJH0_9AGAR|nr:glycoside hydrolase family 18 protein [Roridomyces roridus]
MPPTVFNRLFLAIISLLFLLTRVKAFPANAEDGLDKQARDVLARATPAAPHWVVYGDQYVSGTTGPPAVSALTGYNVFILGFLLVEGAWDKVEEWTTLTAAQRSSVKTQFANAGIKLLVSAFGSTDVPTSTGVDPATTMANFVVQWEFDGIDCDYEDFNAFDAGDGKAENWLISFTTQLRTILPQGQYIITHAPVAPWFSPNIWGGGGYLAVDAAVGNLIDWYNVQFYNQGSKEYTTCTGLLNSSSSTWPNSALFQIAASGVPLSKLVIGKPATSGEADNGYVAPATLAGCLATAKAQGWNAGAMVWEYPGATAAWIQSVRSQSFPV